MCQLTSRSPSSELRKRKDRNPHPSVGANSFKMLPGPKRVSRAPQHSTVGAETCTKPLRLKISACFIFPLFMF